MKKTLPWLVVWHRLTQVFYSDLYRGGHMVIWSVDYQMCRRLWRGWRQKRRITGEWL